MLIVLSIITSEYASICSELDTEALFASKMTSMILKTGSHMGLGKEVIPVSGKELIAATTMELRS